MVTTTKTKEWYLRYPLEDPMHKTALCEIKDEKDFLPENSSVFQPVTARVAAALSMSAADEKLLKENLRALGFGDIVTLAYGEGDRDKIGMCIASRVQGEQLQIAVVLRGTCGEEWYSNFEIGYSAEHSGFARAADFAELRLADYVFTRAICIQPRFFITGYSRGGAVANILAKRLCDRYGLDYVSAYTFAAPSTTISRRTNRYSSIFNNANWLSITLHAAQHAQACFSQIPDLGHIRSINTGTGIDQARFFGCLLKSTCLGINCFSGFPPELCND